LAGIAVRKVAHTAQEMHVPVLGLVENMSHFRCPDTGKLHAVFGPSHAEETAKWIGAPLLGRLPLDPELTTLCDTGCLEDCAADPFGPITQEVVARTPEAHWQNLLPVGPGGSEWFEIVGVG
jgi:hypothetical protein